MTVFEVACHACNAGIGQSCRDDRGFVILPHQGRIDAMLLMDAIEDVEIDYSAPALAPPPKSKPAPRATIQKKKRDDRKARGVCINDERPRTHGCRCEPCYEVHRKSANGSAERRKAA